MKISNMSALEIPRASSELEAKIIIAALKKPDLSFHKNRKIVKKTDRKIYWYGSLAATFLLSLVLFNLSVQQQTRSEADSIKNAVALFNPYDNVHGFKVAHLESTIFDTVDSKQSLH